MHWMKFRERLQLYITMNDVPECKKTVVILICCRATTYSLLRSLMAPEKPAERKVVTIFEAQNNHISPRVSEVVESFKFFQDPGRKRRRWGLHIIFEATGRGLQV
ncbi:hypothetical protein HPB48_007525 [Haemaphysalis longicornis]|uniref:Uncharacterized protein n=1 Tax=Haemaphysalis longicornis TaxID=44386 RepID=A0A9J6GX45_HAELO|nr:hypothetical protein HPB48_007525 [Haemaphysalis longicornis]